MTFKIFKKTGELRDRQGDWDGDEGYEEEIEISDEQVHNDVFNMICETYYMQFIKFGVITQKTMKHFARSIIEDNDLWDNLTENYRDDLCDKYSKEYGNAE